MFHFVKVTAIFTMICLLRQLTHTYLKQLTLVHSEIHKLTFLSFSFSSSFCFSKRMACLNMEEQVHFSPKNNYYRCFY
jgi:hypothetical protein